MNDGYKQGCPVAIALDAIGDRWTLLLLRDLMHAPMRFTDMQQINPTISPNLLAKRLRHLQEAGLVQKRELPPPGAATVYELEERSRSVLLPVLNALGRFGAHLMESAPEAPVELLLRQMGLNAHWILAKGVDFDASFRLRLDPHDIGLRVGPTTFEATATPPDHPDATISSDVVTLTRLFNAGLTRAEAEADGVLKIEGDRSLALALLGRMALGPGIS